MTDKIFSQDAKIDSIENFLTQLEGGESKKNFESMSLEDFLTQAGSESKEHKESCKSISLAGVKSLQGEKNEERSQILLRLAQALKTNTTVKELDLSQLDITPEELVPFFKNLCDNKTLKRIDLSHNKIRTKKEWIDAVKQWLDGTTDIELNLRGNPLGEDRYSCPKIHTSGRTFFSRSIGLGDHFASLIATGRVSKLSLSDCLLSIEVINKLAKALAGENKSSKKQASKTPSEKTSLLGHDSDSETKSRPIARDLRDRPVELDLRGNLVEPSEIAAFNLSKVKTIVNPLLDVPLELDYESDWPFTNALTQKDLDNWWELQKHALSAPEEKNIDEKVAHRALDWLTDQVDKLINGITKEFEYQRTKEHYSSKKLSRAIEQVKDRRSTLNDKIESLADLGRKFSNIQGNWSSRMVKLIANMYKSCVVLKEKFDKPSPAQSQTFVPVPGV